MFLERRDQLFVGRFGELFRDPRVTMGVSTRYGGVSQSPYESLNLAEDSGDDPVSVTENRGRFFSGIGNSESSVASAEQVHGIDVKCVNQPGVSEKTDGLITQTPGLLLTIRIADCLPVFLFDEKTSGIGLLHAGWRGSADGISQVGVNGFIDSFGSDPKDIWAFLGPSIGPCCYQIGSDVAERFPDAYVQDKYLDLWKCNSDQLTRAGIQSNRLIVSRLCTVCQNQWFFSHRAEALTGRMLAFLGLTESAENSRKYGQAVDAEKRDA